MSATAIPYLSPGVGLRSSLGRQPCPTPWLNPYTRSNIAVVSDRPVNAKPTANRVVAMAPLV